MHRIDRAAAAAGWRDFAAALWAIAEILDEAATRACTRAKAAGVGVCSAGSPPAQAAQTRQWPWPPAAIWVGLTASSESGGCCTALLPASRISSPSGVPSPPMVAQHVGQRHSASSSIHSTTERHAPGRPRSAGKLRSGNAPAVCPRRRRAGGAAAEGLGPVGRDAGRAASPPTCYRPPAMAAARMMFVGWWCEPCVAAPAVDRFFEVADHGKAEGGEPRRHHVDQTEQVARGSASRSLSASGCAAGNPSSG